ncbi:DapH/DapD/GlmU-related protein [Demequina salsinemoris]|uniref:DapH/DapD/GlmU-related protein n=1 Tax=Demequina salsinemoris TaxID=577470 RepID=UPI000B00DC43|nr:DapH/DapD/GlmU-related protein [Demequina salsinemoris]
MIRAWLDRLYGSARGLDVGFDPELATRDLIAFAAGKIVARVVGAVRGRPAVFISVGARIAGNSYLRVGTNASIGPAVVIDARSRQGVQLGESVTIDRGAVLRASGVLRDLGEGIRIGERTAIGVGNFIHGGGGVVVGTDCLFGPYVSILSENHRFADPSVPIREQGETRASVTIEDDVWIGAGATVLAGVRIGRGAVVGAGAVVVHDVAEQQIVGGVPARGIGARG